jgi:tyrosinase
MSMAMLGCPAHLAAQASLFVRRSINSMPANDPDLLAMRRAVAAMKALPQSDPRNWVRFADIHRNFCPHGNWYFLPWHRAYLVAFERICRQLSGKADFALPYWNWTANREFPRAFTDDGNSNPLNHPRPGINSLRLADDMVGPQVISRILNSPDFEAFGSARPRGQDSADVQWQRRLGSKTELEFNPHDGVHQSIGGNMATVELSARDPVFYLHHANIDRLWATWNRRGNANASEPMWRNFTFNRNFTDPSGASWNVSVGDLGSVPALGYRYDDDNDPFAADPFSAMSMLTAEKLRTYRRLDSLGLFNAPGLHRIELKTGGFVEVAVADNQSMATRDRPIGISVSLGRPIDQIIAPAVLGAATDGKNSSQSRRYVWAFVHDMEPPLDATTRVRLFCNCQELTPRSSMDDPSYVTSVSFFGAQHSHDSRTLVGGGSVCVDLAPALARAERLTGDRVTVQFLPSCSNNEPNVSNTRPKRLAVVVL